MTVRYSGRLFDTVCYESVVVVEEPVTITKLQEAARSAELELQLAHPSIRLEPEERVRVGFGHQPPILLVRSGTILECYTCGRIGHDRNTCPQK